MRNSARLLNLIVVVVTAVIKHLMCIFYHCGCCNSQKNSINNEHVFLFRVELERSCYLHKHVRETRLNKLSMGLKLKPLFQRYQNCTDTYHNE
jgi:hypothetical protein